MQVNSIVRCVESEDGHEKETENNSPQASTPPARAWSPGREEGRTAIPLQDKPSLEPPSPCISRSLCFLRLASANALDPLMNLFLDYIEEGGAGRGTPSSRCAP